MVMEYIKPQTFTLVVLLFCVSTLCRGRAAELSIDMKIGRDTVSCLNEEDSMLPNLVPCRTLEFVADNVGYHSNNLTIMITTDLQILREVNFSYFSNLTISGQQFVRIGCYLTTSVSVGFRFINVEGLHLNDLSFTQCGAEFRNSTTAAVQMINCTDVSMNNIHFFESIDIAVVFVDTYGMVRVSDSSFKDRYLCDGDKQGYSYPCGISMEFTRKHSTDTTYNLLNCSFTNNTGAAHFSHYSPSTALVEGDWRGQGLGGGLGVIFTDDASDVHITIVNCTFTNNSAQWGGGMYAHYHSRVTSSSITIVDSLFENNNAHRNGGGINVGFLQTSPLENQILITDCTFKNNSAYIAGGTSLFSVHTPRKFSNDSVTFQNCTWLMNRADAGAAVDVSSALFDRLNHGFLPVPLFLNCKFLGNVASDTHEQLRHNDTMYTYSGVFTVTKTAVLFSGDTLFDSNCYTALHATSSKLIFMPNSQILFYKNYGTRGGAIAMYGFSSLIFDDDSSFNFTNNTATDIGGAIYYETFDQQDFTSGRKCFLQYSSKGVCTVDERNINFTFSQNHAPNGGRSIYSTSFYPCFFEWFDTFRGHNLTDFFSKLADFSFDINNDTTASLATDGRYFGNLSTSRFVTIPGKRVSVPFSFRDEFQHERRTLLFLNTKGSNVNQSRMFSVRSVKYFYGYPNDKFTYVVSTHRRIRDVSFASLWTFLPCPPGYYFEKENMTCLCAAEYRGYSYVGITKCKNSEFQAFIRQGYWAGYHNESGEFYTAVCPLSFCVLTTSPVISNSQQVYALPNSSSELNRAMCGDDRHGILCSQCQGNLSVYYHSRKFKCGSNKLCPVGFLFYILSEIFPTIILFGVIITFNVNFTSGSLNGIVFFSQVLDTLTLNTGLNRFEENTRFAFDIIYGVLNFEFFNVKTLSFCLWERATIMDLLAFKYVTVIFALFLVIGIILLMNSRFCSIVPRKVSTKISVMHGLSAFLVICYTQCTKISFYILTRVVLRGRGGVPGPHVTYFGAIPYFGGKHSIYAIPALLCLVTITIIPPVMLFGYPLVFQLLNYLSVSENCAIFWLFSKLPVHKLMPVFDQFQGCFKDKLRFFAGLYFVYRIVILASYSFSFSATQFYVTSEFILVLILGLHSTVHPYKSAVHNSIDSIVLLNLLLINSLSLTYAVESQTQVNGDKTQILTAITIFQQILISIPIICCIVWLLFSKVIKKLDLARCKKGRNETLVESFSLDDLTMGRDLDDSYSVVNYKVIEEKLMNTNSDIDSY